MRSWVLAQSGSPAHPPPPHPFNRLTLVTPLSPRATWFDSSSIRFSFAQRSSRRKKKKGCFWRRIFCRILSLDSSLVDGVLDPRIGTDWKIALWRKVKTVFHIAQCVADLRSDKEQEDVGEVVAASLVARVRASNSLALSRRYGSAPTLRRSRNMSSGVLFLETSIRSFAFLRAPGPPRPTPRLHQAGPTSQRSATLRCESSPLRNDPSDVVPQKVRRGVALGMSEIEPVGSQLRQCDRWVGSCTHPCSRRVVMKLHRVATGNDLREDVIPVQLPPG